MPNGQASGNEGPQEMRVSNLSLERLTFDPENPRLPKSIDGSDEEQVINWMLDDATILELMGSIGSYGFFPGEPLLIVREDREIGQPQDADDPSIRFLVVEGNRRLAAAKLLANPDLAAVRQSGVRRSSEQASFRPSALPGMIFPLRSYILDYLGYRHITGIKEWEPLAKARYLYQLSQRGIDGILPSHTDLARMIGSRSGYVARLLTTLSLYDRIEEQGFFGIEHLNENTLHFSLLATALNYTNIVAFLGLESATTPNLEDLDENRLGLLTEWLFAIRASGKTALGESRNMRVLAEIVENPKAWQALSRGESLQDASLLTRVPDEIFQQSVETSRNALLRAQEHSHLVESPRSVEINHLDEILRLARNLIDVLREKLEASE